MAQELAEDSLQFELPIELESLDVAQATEEDIRKAAVETLRKRTEKHNKSVLQKAGDMEGSEKASFVRRKFVAGLDNVKIVSPGTSYKDVVNGEVVTKITKGYSVACNRVYASGKVGRDIHYPLSI